MRHPALPVALLKKAVTGAVLFAVILSVTGCFGRNGTIGIYAHNSKTLKKIIKYIDENNTEDLYDLFSEDKKSNKCLMERLDALCDFWDEEDLTVKRKRHTSGGGSSDHGKYTYYETRYYIYAESSNGYTYSNIILKDHSFHNTPR